MEYQKRTIKLACVEVPEFTIEAMVGVGTGLAYHPVPSQSDLYTLTHVPTGYAITALTVPTESEAQLFLEKVAVLDCDAWLVDLETLRQRINADPKLLMAIELAHYDALSADEIFMFPDAGEPESFDADIDPQAPSNIALAVEIFFYREYPEPVGRVKLVCMHRETGELEDVHTYTREEVMPRGLAFITHLLKLALIHIDVEPGQAEGQFELEVEGWLATVELHGKRVCLWDFDQDSNWEVYNVVDLSAATGELVEGDEEVRMERMRIHWAEQPHVNTFGDYWGPVCEMSQQEAESLHSGGVEA